MSDSDSSGDNQPFSFRGLPSVRIARRDRSGTSTKSCLPVEPAGPILNP
jgi:hypothetical protein